jgi:hypothetical protein
MGLMKSDSCDKKIQAWQLEHSEFLKKLGVEIKEQNNSLNKESNNSISGLKNVEDVKI